MNERINTHRQQQRGHMMIEYTVQIYERRTEWYLNGKLHRVEGPAIEWSNGDKEWYLNDKRHRVEGPAIEWSYGDKSWWLNGLLHREDGAAIEWASGHKEWFLNGVRVTEAEVMSPVKQPHKPWVGLTEEEVEQIVDGNALGSGYQFWCSGKGVAEGVEALLKEKNT